MHSQHDGTLGPLQPLHEVAGCPSKRRQGLNVARNVQHIYLVYRAPFKVLPEYIISEGYLCWTPGAPEPASGNAERVSPLN
jgi:hypothetical protein